MDHWRVESDGRSLSCYCIAYSGELGTEDALVADATARELLEGVAALTAPVSGSGKVREEVLDSFHRARDKHIFRILSTITDPCQKSKTRARALDDLPKRTKSLGDGVSAWVKNLVRRCNMGDFINEEVIAHCAMLAQECFAAQDIAACHAFLVSVKTASDIFPSLCGQPQTLRTLTELFSDCRAVTSGALKKELDGAEIVTTLSGILSGAIQSQPGKIDPVRTRVCLALRPYSFATDVSILLLNRFWEMTREIKTYRLN